MLSRWYVPIASPRVLPGAQKRGNDWSRLHFGPHRSPIRTSNDAVICTFSKSAGPPGCRKTRKRLIETSIQDLTAHQSEPEKIFFLRRALKAFVIIAYVTFGICRGRRCGCRVGICSWRCCSCRIVVSLAASLGIDFLFKSLFLFFDFFPSPWWRGNAVQEWA